MSYEVFFRFLVNNSMFTFTIVLVSFVLGWLLYNHVVTRGISLRDALFEKDNLAAWIEFIGAFIYPTLYLSAKAVEGSVSENLFIDLLVCVIYVIVYVLLLTVLRLLSGFIVKLLCSGDQEGKINFNREVYEQKNIAASLFSVALSAMFVNIIRFFDVIPEYMLVSILKMSVVIIFSLAAFLFYIANLKRKTTIFKEIFVDNNAAAGVSLLGFVLAVELLLENAILLQVEFNFPDLAALSAMSLVIFGIFSIIFRVVFMKIVKVDFWKEVYEQDNVGAAIGQSALYVGLANVIVHFMK